MSVKKRFLLITIIFMLFILEGFAAYEYVPRMEWGKTLGGSDDEECRSVCQTTDGGYVIAGYAYSYDGNVSGNHGEKDFWIVKLDEKGNIVWQRCLGGSMDDEAYDVIQIDDGGYLVVGMTFSNDGDVKGKHGNSDFGDAWVVKLSEEGKILWQRCLGGMSNDVVYRVIQTGDGGYVLVGGTDSNDGDVRGNHGESWDGWMVKLDKDGNILWQRCLGGRNDDELYNVQKVKNGYIVVGYTYSYDGDVTINKGAEDLWILKLDEQGKIQWGKTLGGSNNDVAWSVEEIKDGGYIVVGWTYSKDKDVEGNHGESDAWIIKLDEMGNVEWKKCLGGSKLDWLYSVQKLSDDIYVMVGGTSSSNGDVKGNHGYHDWWVILLDKDGNVLWQKCLGGNDDEEAFCVQRTRDKGFVVVGYTYSYDGDVTGNHGGEDFWIVKFK